MYIRGSSFLYISLRIKEWPHIYNPETWWEDLAAMIQSELYTPTTPEKGPVYHAMDITSPMLTNLTSNSTNLNTPDWNINPQTPSNANFDATDDTPSMISMINDLNELAQQDNVETIPHHFTPSSPQPSTSTAMDSSMPCSDDTRIRVEPALASTNFWFNSHANNIPCAWIKPWLKIDPVPAPVEVPNPPPINTEHDPIVISDED